MGMKQDYLTYQPTKGTYLGRWDGQDSLPRHCYCAQAQSAATRRAGSKGKGIRRGESMVTERMIHPYRIGV